MYLARIPADNYVSIPREVDDNLVRAPRCLRDGLKKAGILRRGKSFFMRQIIQQRCKAAKVFCALRAGDLHISALPGLRSVRHLLLRFWRNVSSVGARSIMKVCTSIFCAAKPARCMASGT